MALQTDDYSVNGRRLTKLLEPLSPVIAAADEGLKLLKAWNHRTSVDSAGAALFEVWMTKHLGRALVGQGRSGTGPGGPRHARCQRRHHLSGEPGQRARS